MTGFARVEGSQGAAAWTWEARSVNAKAFDLRCRLAPGFETLEGTVRNEAAGRFRRGNITVGLAVTRSEAAPRLRVNRTLLDEIVAAARDLDPDRPPRIDALLGIRGVIEAAEEDDPDEREAWSAAIAADLPEVLDRLAQARAGEGAQLAGVLHGQIDAIAGLVGAAGRTAATRPEMLRARLREQVTALLDAVPALSEERLAQEAALLIARGDVREELDRLGAHIVQARELLAAGSPNGRRLDFLCQEFNREANTLCSKSSDVELTRIGLELKAVIEQFREQVQNIE